MKSYSTKIGFLSLLLLAALSANAQSTEGGTSDQFFVGVIVFVVFALLFVIILVADRLMHVTAEQVGAKQEGLNFSVFPRLTEIFHPNSSSSYANGRVVSLKKGFNIPLEGEAKQEIGGFVGVRYAIKTADFIGISPIPKLLVEVGDDVKAGDSLFYDKKHPAVMFCSPVSGQVIAINRGEKRRIEQVVILADKEQVYRSFSLPDLETSSREALMNFLGACGMMPFFKQRPYNVMPEMGVSPKNIFISTFNTAPLAADADFLVQGNEAAFQKGLDVLSKLTDGKVHLGLNANGSSAPSSAFVEAKGVEKTWFKGVHPAGNVGVQIHHTAPINKGDIVWTATVQSVIVLGRLFLEGRFNTETLVALTGAELKENHYVKTYQGVSVEDLVKGNLKNDHIRFVSGDVLSGSEVSKESFMGFGDTQLTVLQEGDYYEMFGWLLASKPKPSISKSIPRLFYPEKFVADTNTHGEHRAFVVTGQYEQVLPMEVYPQHLLKAILVNDLEQMEGLGIYEVVEEDFALCEFACTSKQAVQQILRSGLETMRAQG